MLSLLRTTLSKLSFRRQLLIVFAFGILCLAIVSSLVISSITEKRLHSLLLEQGQTITDTFASQSTLALLYQSPDTAKEVSQPILAFPSVVGLSIITQKSDVLFQQGEKSHGDNIVGDITGITTHYETESAWYFSQPVYAGLDNSAEEDSPFATEEAEPELIGHVEIVLSKDVLAATSQSILKNNLITASIVASILLLILTTVTNKITQPIRDLSDIMKRAEKGEQNVRADLSGSEDIINMEKAFNTMMSVLESREQELKRARDTALASARVKGEFATTVSHELRTPMNGVMGMLELVQSMDLTEEQKEYINIARSSGEELLLLIDDILDFSKIESGKLKLLPSNFDPHDMVKGITELLSPQAQQKNIELSGDLDITVPNALMADSHRIRQVLINLVGNAIKFTPSGTVKIRMSLNKRDTDEKQYLHVAVEDTGIGIADDAKHLIFEAFSQADGSTTRQFGGTGLGLAISNQLVELMGGKIGVKSEVGKGSVFWFMLPISLSDETVTLNNIIPADLIGMRVLIVSRTPESCHALINKFTSWECYQRNTTTAEEAITLLQSALTQGRPFDFVIVDTPINDEGESKLLDALEKNETLVANKMIMLAHNKPKNQKKNVSSLPKTPSIELLENTLLKFIRQNNTNATVKNRKPFEFKTMSGKVLIVEDNQTNQIVAKSMVKKLGCECELAENGNAAITALEKEQFDIVLMDCNMPFMNGYTASQLIRGKQSRYQDIPIIALTANTGPMDVNRCFTSGMNDYLSKPLSIENLEPKLRNWLNKETKFLRPEEVRKLATGNSAEILTNDDDEPIQTLNVSVIEGLKNQISTSFRDVVDAYLNDTPSYIESLVIAVENEDIPQIRYYSQIIKGSSSNLGAMKLENYSRAIERLCSTDDFFNIKNLTADIQSEFKQVKKFITPHLESTFEPLEESNQNSFQPKILVVDDDKGSRMIMRSILNKDGYTINEACNGLEALNICKENMPDLILMDALMPEMGGFEACEEIMAIDSESYPTVLIITALQDEGTLEKAFAAGAADFILKPINMTVLRQRVSRMLHAGHIDRHIHQLSYYDNLTSLPNRTYFLERTKTLIAHAEQNNNYVAIIFLDLDRFKIINDTQGHDAGDLLLKAFAKRLEHCVRSADLVARLGDDEFTVVVNNIASREDAAIVANKIIDAMKQPFDATEQQVHITNSIGIALFPEAGDSINELMKHADTAMVHAKSNGGNCYEFYEEGMESEITQQIELEAEIRTALETDQFVLYYQPQIDLSTGKLTGIEALIRWEHPEKGLIPPFHFIPFAEKNGLITNIGDWVLREACRQQREWLDRGMSPVPIAVNVSGGELSDSVLLAKVETALSNYDIPPHLIKLEITEDTLAGSNDQTTQHLHDLRNLGTTLAIDDFGTGYSSLSYLKMFPVDTLKIDRSFVKDLPGDANSAAIVSGIIALGHSLKLLIVAEGVETKEQKAFLQQQNCDIMQGYYSSKPLPVNQLESWIISENVHAGYLTYSPSTNATTAKASHRTRRLP